MVCGGLMLMADIFLNCCPTYCLRKGPSLNLGLTNLPRLVGQWALGTCLCHSTLGFPACIVTTGIYISFGNQTQVLMFMSWSPLLSHPPSNFPTIYIYKYMCRTLNFLLFSSVIWILFKRTTKNNFTLIIFSGFICVHFNKKHKQQKQNRGQKTNTVNFMETLATLC